MDERELDRRAHEIAVSLLPDMAKADRISYFVKTGPRSEEVDMDSVMDLYYIVYEAALKHLQEYYGFDR